MILHIFSEKINDHTQLEEKYQQPTKYMSSISKSRTFTHFQTLSMKGLQQGS